MQIQMTGHNVEITPAIRSYSEKKLQRVITHAVKIINIHLTLHVEKLNQVAECLISIPGSKIHASASSDNMYESIDKLTDKLIRQLNAHKEKFTDRG